jgi:4-hydroxy-4-methyl-2-oxoglutarate aldolase
VIDGPGIGQVSLMGGRAAAAARRAGLAAAVVNGGVRDLNEIRRVGLSVWSATITPITGKARAEAPPRTRRCPVAACRCCPATSRSPTTRASASVPNEPARAVAGRALEVAACEAAALGG